MGKGSGTPTTTIRKSIATGRITPEKDFGKSKPSSQPNSMRKMASTRHAAHTGPSPLLGSSQKKVQHEKEKLKTLSQDNLDDSGVVDLDAVRKACSESSVSELQTALGDAILPKMESLGKSKLSKGKTILDDLDDEDEDDSDYVPEEEEDDDDNEDVGAFEAKGDDEIEDDDEGDSPVELEKEDDISLSQDQQKNEVHEELRRMFSQALEKVIYEEDENDEEYVPLEEDEDDDDEKDKEALKNLSLEKEDNVTLIQEQRAYEVREELRRKFGYAYQKALEKNLEEDDDEKDADYVPGGGKDRQEGISLLQEQLAHEMRKELRQKFLKLKGNRTVKRRKMLRSAFNMLKTEAVSEEMNPLDFSGELYEGEFESLLEQVEKVRSQRIERNEKQRLKVQQFKRRRLLSSMVENGSLSPEQAAAVSKGIEKGAYDIDYDEEDDDMDGGISLKGLKEEHEAAKDYLNELNARRQLRLIDQEMKLTAHLTSAVDKMASFDYEKMSTEDATNIMNAQLEILDGMCQMLKESSKTDDELGSSVAGKGGDLRNRLKADKVAETVRQSKVLEEACQTAKDLAAAKSFLKQRYQKMKKKQLRQNSNVLKRSQGGLNEQKKQAAEFAAVQNLLEENDDDAEISMRNESEMIDGRELSRKPPTFQQWMKNQKNKEQHSANPFNRWQALKEKQIRKEWNEKRRLQRPLPSSLRQNQNRQNVSNMKMKRTKKPLNASALLRSIRERKLRVVGKSIPIHRNGAARAMPRRMMKKNKIISNILKKKKTKMFGEKIPSILRRTKKNLRNLRKIQRMPQYKPRNNNQNIFGSTQVHGANAHVIEKEKYKRELFHFVDNREPVIATYKASDKGLYQEREAEICNSYSNYWLNFKSKPQQRQNPLHIQREKNVPQRRRRVNLESVKLKKDKFLSFQNYAHDYAEECDGSEIDTDLEEKPTLPYPYPKTHHKFRAKQNGVTSGQLRFQSKINDLERRYKHVVDDNAPEYAIDIKASSKKNKGDMGARLRAKVDELEARYRNQVEDEEPALGFHPNQNTPKYGRAEMRLRMLQRKLESNGDYDSEEESLFEPVVPQCLINSANQNDGLGNWGRRFRSLRDPNDSKMMQRRYQYQTAVQTLKNDTNEKALKGLELLGSYF
eukprot:g5406.t1